jgi:ADP-heptose:LPS heptosyltransferase
MSDDHNVRVLTSVIENNLRILELLGHPTPASEPSMFIDKADLLAGDDLLRQEKIPEGGPLIAFAVQGSGAQPVNWFDERFVELGNRLFDRYGARLAFFGTSRDGAGIEKIRMQMRAPSFNFAGKTAIPTLAAIFCRMDLMISVDTGLMHLGRAIQLPLVLLASAYQTSKEWLPAGIENCLVLRHGEVPCALCWKPSCATRECMQAISVEDVMEAVGIQFQKFPPTAAQREQRTARAVAQTRSQALSAGQAVPVR